MTVQQKTGSLSSRAKADRLPELDYIKALCILAMVLVHCYEEIYDGSGSGASTLFVDIFNNIIGASAFMFCMGFTLNLSRERSVEDCAKRGCTLFLSGLLLNFLRSPLIRCVNLLTDSPDNVFGGMIDVLAVDILPFAGLAFLLMALLKKCRLGPWGIFGVAFLLSGTATLFRHTDTGMPVVNALLAFFIGSEAESYFPLCHWFIFVAAGNLYRRYYTKIENKKAYYAVALPIFTLLSAGYCLLAGYGVGPFQSLQGDITFYTWMNPCDAIGCIVCVMMYMGFMWLLAQGAEKLQPRVRPLTYLAENLSVLYFIHWILLMLVEYVLMGGFELLNWPESDLGLFLCAIGFLALTVGVCEVYKKHWHSGLLGSVTRHPALWIAVILVLVVACVVLSVTHGLTEVPSFLNDYSAGGITL